MRFDQNYSWKHLQVSSFWKYDLFSKKQKPNENLASDGSLDKVAAYITGLDAV